MKETIVKINKTKRWFFEKINKINKSLARFIKRKKILEANDEENTTTQNLWDAAKAVLSEKFIAIQSYLKK